MKYKVGDEIEGIITGIQPYGAFVYVDSKNQGLIHISEITSDFVENIEDYVKINEKVRARILGIDPTTFQLRLSIKALQTRKQRRFQQFAKRKELPVMELGFSTLEKQLPLWIAQALERMNKND